MGIITKGTESLSAPHIQRVTFRTMRSCKPGIRQKLHYFAFGLWAIFTAIVLRPRWIYVSDPLASPIGWTLSWLPFLGIVYHEHDTATGDDDEEVLSPFMQLIVRMRGRLARRATFCVLPNQLRIARFRLETETRRPVLCVWNCPSLSETKKIIPSPTGSQFTVFFHGSIVPQRLPLAVIEALAQCSEEIHLRFAGYETIGHFGYIGELLTKAQQTGISSRVHYLGALPRLESLARCAEADVGLAFMPLHHGDFNMRSMVGASNKPFDYLLSGLALLVSDLPDWREAFVDMGYGIACDPEDPDKIARTFRWFKEHREETRRMGEKGRNRILDEWNYETQFSTVVRQMKETV